MLRKLEYIHNCKKSLFYRLYYIALRWRFESLSERLGFSIPINVFGPGLAIAHYGTIVVNGAARVGCNCRINACVNIGTKAGFDDKAPILGNNICIGPGAKIFGPIEIADDIAIGANSVVNKSFKEKGITIAGVPARKVSCKGSKSLHSRATEIIRDKGVKST